MIENTTNFVNHLSNLDSDYICKPLNDFFSYTEIPTPFKKNPGLLLLFITEGEMKAEVAYEDIKIEKNSILIIQPNKPFSFKKTSENIKGIALYIKSNGMIGTMGDHSLIFSLDILDTWSTSVYKIKPNTSYFIENIFKRILFESSKFNCNLTIVNAYVITLFFEIKGIYKGGLGSNLAAIDLTRRFKKEVYKNMDKNLSVTNYADKLAVTPNHLNKSVKMVTQMSTTKLLGKMKIIEAKFLLLRVDTSVSEVANRLGFEDLSYFSRFFKKHEGITPIDFRKKISQNI